MKRKCWPKNLFVFASVTSGLQRLLGVYVEDADIVKKPETETTFKEKKHVRGHKFYSKAGLSFLYAWFDYHLCF